MIHELGENIIPVLAITGTFLFLTSWVIAATVDSIYKTYSNTKLKAKLAERGMSASEIDQIVKAGVDPGENVRPVPPIKT